MILTFESLNKTKRCGHSNKSASTVPSYATDCFSVFNQTNFFIIFNLTLDALWEEGGGGKKRIFEHKSCNRV